MIIRAVNPRDLEHWARMRGQLWPDSADSHVSEIELFFAGISGEVQACFLIDVDESPVGFIELNLRNYAEGSSSARVPYVEGWFIEEKHRGLGFGKRLMKRAEAWAREQGCSELASDAELDNEISIAAHKRLGFEETDRIVCFLKKL